MIPSARHVLLPAALLLLPSACLSGRAPSASRALPLRRAPPLPLTRTRTLTLAAPEAPGGPAYVSAASGLVRVGDWLHVVADDSLFLASFAARGEGPGRLVRLFPGELPRGVEERRAAKPDLEALCLVEGLASAPDGALLAVPSGSAPVRMRGALVALQADGHLTASVREVDFSALYAGLARELGSVNVEGAVWVGPELWLLNRGNGAEDTNAVVKLSGEGFRRALETGTPPDAGLVLRVVREPLGRLHGVRLTFSDAAPLPDGRVLFIASAEDTASPFSDGGVVGSAVGMLSPEGTPLWMERVEGRVKLEGVTVREEEGRLRLWLVSDADDPRVVAPLFELTLDAAAPPAAPPAAPASRAGHRAGSQGYSFSRIGKGLAE